MKIVLASLNPNKCRELRKPLKLLGIELVSQTELGILTSAEETGSTFAENAEQKARHVMEASGLPALADDSGLSVDALNGAPGIHSHRFGNQDSDAGRCRYLLEQMKDVPDGQRDARFVCVIVLLFPDGRKLIAEGTCPGVILHECRGENGFGYDPLFCLPERGKTFAELTEEEKLAVSHRGNALLDFAEKYKELNAYFNE